MKWNFINSGFNTGDFNMRYDIALSKTLQKDQAILRLYRWKPYCISLGFNQDDSYIDKNKIAQEGIGLVKRPTGGRAVLHAEELTYSVVAPVEMIESPKKLYEDISLALKTGLEIYNPKLFEIDLEKTQADFRSLYEEERGIVCFAVPAKNELKFRERKLVGSAQRKMKDTILQHGSILCGNYHKNIINYLNVESSAYAEIIRDLKQNTTEIETILGEKVNYNDLSESIFKGFEGYFNMNFMPYKFEF